MPQEPEHVCTLISKRLDRLDLYDKDGQIEELCDLVNELKSRCEEWATYVSFLQVEHKHKVDDLEMRLSDDTYLLETKIEGLQSRIDELENILQPV